MKAPQVEIAPKVATSIDDQVMCALLRTVHTMSHVKNIGMTQSNRRLEWSAFIPTSPIFFLTLYPNVCLNPSRGSSDMRYGPLRLLRELFDRLELGEEEELALQSRECVYYSPVSHL